MLETIKETFLGLLPFIVSMSGIMLSNALTGAWKGKESGKFKWATLFDGICKYIIYLAAFVIGFISLTIFGGEIEIVDESSLLTLMTLTQTGIFGYYAIKLINNFRELGELKKILSSETKETTTETEEDEEVGAIG